MFSRNGAARLRRSQQARPRDNSQQSAHNLKTYYINIDRLNHKDTKFTEETTGQSFRVFFVLSVSPWLINYLALQAERLGGHDDFDFFHFIWLRA